MKHRVVLYQPKQIDESLGVESSRDLLPLEMLTIAGFPLLDGFEVVLIDGSLHRGSRGHELLVQACEGALCVATTGMLGYMLIDADAAMRRVKARHPKLPMLLGGWFASVCPTIQLETGLYDAVVHGQGELTFRDVLAALQSGADLVDVPGLSVLRDGEVVRTSHRPIVGWNELPDLPWHLVDIEPYREHQLRSGSSRDFLRLPGPEEIRPGRHEVPYFGISYYSSYGCPEPCAFCCSPEVTQRRWKAMPAERMLDDLEALHDRWGFDVVRIQDANFGVMQKRVASFTNGMLERELPVKWNCFMETHSVLHYRPEVLDQLAASGLYIAQIGAEAGTDAMMQRIGKPIRGDDNIDASVELDRRGVQSSINYIIGYPGEDEASMLASIEQCRRVNVAAPLSRATVWPYRPVPGTKMWDEALAEGFQGPQSLREWGELGEYHLDVTWQANIPAHIDLVRRLYQHYASVSYGIVRGKIGFWERRARRRLVDGSYRRARLEARVFNALERTRRVLLPST